MLLAIAWIAGPGLLGALMQWFAGKCKGKNARDSFRLAGWGFWLLYLWHVGPFIIPIIGPLLMLIPSGICFMLAFNSIVKEMRAQKNGEFTEAA